LTCSGQVLGAFIDGDQLDQWRAGQWLALPKEVAHVVALGATGSGKTETILRLAACHLASGWRVIVIDAKEDQSGRERFVQLALQLGVSEGRTRTWPESGPMDLCRGSAHAQKDRWMASAAWTEPYYRAVAATFLTLVCEDPEGAPSIPSELLERLDKSYLVGRWAGTPGGKMASQTNSQDLIGLRHRYFGLISDLSQAGAIPIAGESSWSWEDGDAIWITLPTSTRPEVAGALGRAALIDMVGYIRDENRRPDRRPILWIIEEMGALTSSDPTTALAVIEAVERARSANVRCVVSAQTPEGLGDLNAQARLLHGGPAVLAHRMANPEPFVRLLGSQMGLEASIAVDAAGNFGDHGSLREQHQWRVSPDTVRRLPVGQALIAHAGRWAMVAVARAAAEADGGEAGASLPHSSRFGT
jgi:hypothetical protein